MLVSVTQILKRSLWLLSIVVLIWTFVAIEPTGIFARSKAHAISECDKIAVDKGSLLTDNEACANPCESTVSTISSTPSTPGKLFILGDSIGEGLTSPLTSKLTAASPGWSVTADTRVGRPLSEGLSIASSNPPAMQGAQYILVVLGTNSLGNTTNQADVSALMSKLNSTGAKIYWLKINVSRSDLTQGMVSFNELLQSSGANLIDNAVAPGGDGVHPSNYDQLADSVAQRLQSSTPTENSGGESLQSLATQMLNNSNITYWTNNGVNTRDVVVALSQGKKAYTTASNATNKEADLNPNILKFILEVAQTHKIMVNALTDKTHTDGSNHYKGLAVDLDNNGTNSPPTSVLDPIAAKYGGTRNSETTHWHYDFTNTASADATSQTTQQTASCCATTTNQPSSTSTGAKDLQEFIDKYGQLAFNTGKKYGIPYEAIIAQASVESAKGNSQLTREANNFFGIKAGSSWTGPTWTGPTSEQTPDGQSYTISAAFRAYPNAQAGFDGYGEFITSNSRYKNALNYPGDPVQYITEIRNAGYATDVQYVTTLTRVINQVTNYIKQTGKFPPSSEVTPDAKPPTAGGGSGSYIDCNGLLTQQSGDGSVASNKQIAQGILIQKGLPDSEWQCLDKLWTRESGWRTDAKNPSSSAYGIPQALAAKPGDPPGSKMASAGADWKTNPLTQINWGLGYIEGRYKTPCGAWAHSEAVGWY